MGDLTTNFSRAEFTCPCGCGFDTINSSLVRMLQEIRDKVGMIEITSGFRCKTHNSEIGGVEKSAHMRGQAVDIKVHGSQHRFHLLKSAIDSGFTRIGIGQGFLHLDIDTTKPSHVAFDYYSKDHVA